jgi:hypothetical protein
MNRVDKKYSLNSHILVEQIDDVILVFNPENSMLYTLNNTSSYIFNSILQGIEEDTIISGYSEVFSTSIQIAREDFISCIKRLTTLDIILRQNSHTP